MGLGLLMTMKYFDERKTIFFHRNNLGLLSYQRKSFNKCEISEKIVDRFASSINI
jgi:hypothetical protein